MKHLVLDTCSEGDYTGLVTIACTQPAGLEPYDGLRHTYLTMFADCPECLVVNAAWGEAFNAWLRYQPGRGDR